MNPVPALQATAAHLGPLRRDPVAEAFTVPRAAQRSFVLLGTIARTAPQNQLYAAEAITASVRVLDLVDALLVTLLRAKQLMFALLASLVCSKSLVSSAPPAPLAPTRPRREALRATHALVEKPLYHSEVPALGNVCPLLLSMAQALCSFLLSSSRSD